MKNIIQLLILSDYKYDKNENAYSFTSNSIRHFAELTDTSIRLYSCDEGTDGETTRLDTGIIDNPSIDFVSSIINKQKEMIYE